MSKSKKNTSHSNVDTVIGQSSIIEGKIISQASLRIEGQIKGDIECDGDLTIGAEGDVHSNISARNVYAAGKIHGSITAKEKLTVTNTGQIFGSITVGSLDIAEGGVFQGVSKMDTHNTSITEEIVHPTPHLHKVEKSAAAQ